VGSHLVQVTRTYPPAHPPPGELSTRNALANAIGKAHRYIYLEDQFAYPYGGPEQYDATQDAGITTALREALARDTFEFMIIVAPRLGGQQRLHRLRFLNALREMPGASTKVRIFSLVDPSAGNHEIYVHSKVWIIDDVYVKIGSANCCRRSLTNDSEVDIHVIDEALRGGGRRFARDLRVRLWAEHLDIPEHARLQDPTYAATLWPRAGMRGRVRPDQSSLDIEDDSSTSWDKVDVDGRT
jgi:phosphatidylserine/phosphatidylglycerophosphate/cardiolipin synthase-like enzyme